MLAAAGTAALVEDNIGGNESLRLQVLCAKIAQKPPFPIPLRPKARSHKPTPRGCAVTVEQLERAGGLCSTLLQLSSPEAAQILAERMNLVRANYGTRLLCRGQVRHHNM
eukprot:2921832-Pyramimonas_sp.AAC.1